MKDQILPECVILVRGPGLGRLEESRVELTEFVKNAKLQQVSAHAAVRMLYGTDYKRNENAKYVNDNERL
jgi:hypothetical protein